jgi:hypothetical protein
MMTVTRCFVSWLLAEGWLALTIVAALSLAFGNFVVAWQSFAAQGYEQVPLRQIPFLGPWAEAFGLGDAPLAALYALVLTVAMNIAIITSAKMLVRMMQLYFDYRGLLRSPDSSVRGRAADCLDLLLKTALWFAPMLGLSIAIIMFDVAQFRFRYEALFQGLTDPAEALQWAPEPMARLGQFLAGFILTAVWGYMGCVVGVALAMEYGFVRAAEQWQVLDNAIRQAIEGDGTREAQPAFQQAEVLADARQPAPRASVGAPANPIPAPVSGGAPEAAPVSASRAPEPVAAPQAPTQPPVAAPPQAGPEAEVIVGPGETRHIPLADIEAHPDQFVRDGSGRAWFLRTYYEQGVMGRETQGEDRR